MLKPYIYYNKILRLDLFVFTPQTNYARIHLVGTTEKVGPPEFTFHTTGKCNGVCLNQTGQMSKYPKTVQNGFDRAVGQN